MPTPMQNKRPSMQACIAMCFCLSALFEAGNALADDAVVAVTTAPVQRALIAQPVRAYGIVAASAANLTSINLPYVVRVTQLRVQTGQPVKRGDRSEEHTSELQSHLNLVCRLLLEKKKR